MDTNQEGKLTDPRLSAFIGGPQFFLPATFAIIFSRHA
jgi:hypothetical protein